MSACTKPHEHIAGFVCSGERGHAGVCGPWVPKPIDPDTLPRFSVRQVEEWRAKAIALAEAYLHSEPRNAFEGEPLDKLAKYSNGTVRRIVAGLRALGLEEGT